MRIGIWAKKNGKSFKLCLQVLRQNHEYRPGELCSGFMGPTEVKEGAI